MPDHDHHAVLDHDGENLVAFPLIYFQEDPAPTRPTPRRPLPHLPPPPFPLGPLRAERCHFDL
jgi:hypothetical protein